MINISSTLIESENGLEESPTAHCESLNSQKMLSAILIKSAKMKNRKSEIRSQNLMILLEFQIHLDN